MKIMAVDFGDSRTGIACCDKTEMLASPVCVISEKDFDECINKTALAAKENRADIIVVGYPKNMNNTEGDRCEKTKEFKELLEKRCNLPVILWDERLTTVAADNSMMEMGIRRENRKEYVDEIAAIFILQGYLDYLSNHPQELSADEA